MGDSGLRKHCSGCRKGRTDRYGQVWLQGLSHKVSVVNHRMGAIIPKVLGMEQSVLLELPGTSAFYSRGNRTEVWEVRILCPRSFKELRTGHLNVG